MLDGHDIPSGVCFYRIDAGPFSKTMKLIFLK